MSWLKYSVLTGEIVTLEPLEVKHEKDLIDVALDGTLWNKWTTSVPRPKDTARLGIPGMQRVYKELG